MGLKSQLFGRLRQEDHNSEATVQIQGQPVQLTEMQSQRRGKEKVSPAAMGGQFGCRQRQSGSSGLPPFPYIAFT